MKSIKNAATPVLIVTLLTASGFAASQLLPAWAGKSVSQALIDPELEQALSSHFKKRFFNLIDASEDQKSQLSSLLSKQLDDARPIRTQIRENLLDLSDLMASDSASDEAITKKVQEIRDLREQIQDKRLSTVLKARAVLTKEQRQIVSNRVKGFLTGNPRLGLMKPE